MNGYKMSFRGGMEQVPKTKTGAVAALQPRREASATDQRR
jgi:hypothetical protein